VVRPVTTYITPPRLSSLPAERAQLEYSSRSIAFADDGRRLLRAWGPPDRPWVLGVEPGASRWKVEAWGASPAEARVAARALFSLDHRLEEFYRLVRAEPVLRGTERKFRGLRLPRDASVYESLLYAIIGQQLSVRAASAIAERLLDRAGGTLEAGGVEVPTVPTPERLRALPIDDLRRLGLSRVKSSSLRSLAAWARADPPSTSHLGGLDRATAIETLDALPGVGRWTAENALLRGAGRTDVFVAGDLGVRVALERYAGIARARPEEEARAWAERHYPGWGGYATLYLWRKLVTDRVGTAAGWRAVRPPSGNSRTTRCSAPCGPIRLSLRATARTRTTGAAGGDPRPASRSTARSRARGDRTRNSVTCGTYSRGSGGHPIGASASVTRRAS
jgi:3-methyladenine DNA glycosylase/8-oxoguanine DNA glycosylase